MRGDPARLNWLSNNLHRIYIGYYPNATYFVRIYEAVERPPAYEPQTWWEKITGKRRLKITVPLCLGAGESVREAIDEAIRKENVRDLCD